MRKAVFYGLIAVLVLCFVTAGRAADSKSQPKSTSSAPKSSPSPAQASPQKSTQSNVQTSTGTANIPRDVSQTPTGKVLKDTATGLQSPGKTFARRATPGSF